VQNSVALLHHTRLNSQQKICPFPHPGTSVVVKESQGQGQGQGLDVPLQGRALENRSLKILTEKDFPQGQQHCCEAVQRDRHELEPDRGTMANKPLIHHSVTAR